MAIIGDSGAVYGLYDRRDAFHAGLRAAIERARDVIVLPAPTLGEIDYLLRVRLGNPALLRFLADIQEGAFVVESVTLADLRRCAALIARYRDLDLGLSDASVVAVAERAQRALRDCLTHANAMIPVCRRSMSKWRSRRPRNVCGR